MIDFNKEAEEIMGLFCIDNDDTYKSYLANKLEIMFMKGKLEAAREVKSRFEIQKKEKADEPDM